MASHRFSPARFYNAIGTHPPELEVADGDTVIAATLDAHGFDGAGVQRAERPNPMSGPIAIKGAEPGDVLVVKIVRITLTRATGWTFSSLAPQVVDPGAVAKLPARDKTTWIIDAVKGVVRLEAPPAALAQWSVPIAPMIGCFGVAPALGQAISTATSGPYGGNMDYRGFGPGVTVRFPVFAPGALFFFGDVHAVQGDGEICGTGVETAAEVEFVLSLEKNRRIGWPRGETAEDIFTIGNARPLDQALQHATSEMLAWLGEDYGLDPLPAAHVLGQAVRYNVANVFNPAYSMVCRIAKAALPGGR